MKGQLEAAQDALADAVEDLRRWNRSTSANTAQVRR